jgi:hypothetical protein
VTPAWRRYRTLAVGYITRHAALFTMLAYFMASTLLTWKLVFQLNSTLFGDYGDTRGGVWWLWARINGLLDGPINHLIAAPFGLPNDRDFSQPVSDWLSIILARLTNEIAGYNLFVFLAFPLTAIATYFLLNWLLHNRIAAVAGGLIFGFCPAAVMQAAAGHAPFAFNAFIPLFLLALFYNRAQRTLVSAFCASSCFALITLTALYFGYFAIYIAVFFVVFDLLNNKGGDRRAIFLNYLYAAIFAGVLILPFEYKAIYQQIAVGGDTLAKVGRIRDFRELNIYSSRPWEFLIPSIDHPVLGRLFYDFVRTHLHGSNVPEQTLYLGMVPVGLLLAGIVHVVRRKLDAGYRSYFLFFAFGALWVYFLSLPPLISLGGVNVPTMSFFAYKVAPMFRVYARFGILVNLFVACAAAVVLAHLYQRMKRARYYAMLAILLPLLMFEYWSVPPGYALAVDQPPKVYRWLAEQPGDLIVAEYPMMRWDEAAIYTYYFWQRIHKKKLVNGASPENARAWAFFEKVRNLGDPQTPALLKAEGVKYVIVHKRMYAEGPIPAPIKRYYPALDSGAAYSGGIAPSILYPLKLFKTFGTDMVFLLDDVPAGTTPKSARQPLDMGP